MLRYAAPSIYNITRGSSNYKCCFRKLLPSVYNTRRASHSQSACYLQHFKLQMLISQRLPSSYKISVSSHSQSVCYLQHFKPLSADFLCQSPQQQGVSANDFWFVFCRPKLSRQTFLKNQAFQATPCANPTIGSELFATIRNNSPPNVDVWRCGGMAVWLTGSVAVRQAVCVAGWL